MNRGRALLIILILWAAIYLPGLGSTEFKGEEGRRVLPAIAMLEGGNWLVPHVGGKPFLRKPPLVNWLIAGSFRVTGIRNEWTARLPSALCVLALVGTIIGLSSGRGWMEPRTGLLAAIFVLTPFGLLAKARFAGAEIEAIYVPLTGLAIVLWMAWWAQRRSPWLTWTIPFVFLGLAALAKGPSLHLLFFYAIVFASLWAAKQWRALWHPAHFAGIVIAVALFAAWAIPFYNSTDPGEVAAVWKRQGIDRFTESEFNPANYFLNIPRALMDQLPWVLLVPVAFGAMRRRPGDSEIDRRQWAVGLAIGACFFILLLIPGVLPRYVLPLGVPFALLLAAALGAGGNGNNGTHEEKRFLSIWHRANQGFAGLLIMVAFLTPVAAGGDLAATSVAQALKGIDISLAIRGALLATFAIALCIGLLVRRSRLLDPLQLALGTAILFGVASLLYSVAATRWINRADSTRPLAAQIDAAISPGQRLLIYDPGYFAALCYVRSPHQYIVDFDKVPKEAEIVLIRSQALKKFARKRPELREAARFREKNGQEYLLMRRAGDKVTR